MQLYFAHLYFLYFKKTQLFFTGIFSFASRNPRGSGYLCCYQLNYPANNCSVMHPVIWSFPVWLSISLSYPMTVFSSNLFDVFMEKSFTDQILHVKNWAVYAYILKWDTLYTCILSRHIYTYASSTALFSISFCPTIRFKYAFFYT